MTARHASAETDAGSVGVILVRKNLNSHILRSGRSQYCREERRGCVREQAPQVCAVYTYLELEHARPLSPLCAPVALEDDVSQVVGETPRTGLDQFKLLVRWSAVDVVSAVEKTARKRMDVW